MKALSITQPWCGAILHLGKRIENRQRWENCHYRGPILLHAAKGVGTRADFDDTVEWILNALKPQGQDDRRKTIEALGVEILMGGRGFHHANGHWVPKLNMPRMGIVGMATIAGVVRTKADVHRAEDELAAWELDTGDQTRWWMGGFALFLKDVRPLPFLPWKGALGLFEVPDNVVKPLIARAR